MWLDELKQSKPLHFFLRKIVSIKREQCAFPPKEVDHRRLIQSAFSGFLLLENGQSWKIIR